MSEMHAEIERTIRVTVTVNIPRLCEHYAGDRARFDGTDVEFAKDFINSEAYELLTDTSDQGDGFTVTEDYDETEVSVYGVLA